MREAGRFHEGSKEVDVGDEVVFVDGARFGDARPADEERSSGAGEVGVGFGKGEGGAVVGEEDDEGVVSEARFLEGFEDAADGVIESADRVVVVRKFFANLREIGEVTGNEDLVRRVEFGRCAP